jgi:GRAM domain-containing protein 4
MLRILWSLVRRRIFPYPTLVELRQRRSEVAKAEEFGEGITARLTKTSNFGVRDAWKVVQNFRSLSDLNLSMGKQEDSASSPDDSSPAIGMTEATLSETPSEQHLLMLALMLLNAIADAHERVRK